MAKRTGSILSQIAASASPDQPIITITSGNKKLLLPIEGRINIKGEFCYVQLPEVDGVFVAASNGNLSKASAADLTNAEAVFFPERAEELAKLAELAKKYGMVLQRPTEAGEVKVKRTRSPKGERKTPLGPKRDLPVVGDKFVSTVNGITYTVKSFEDKTITLKGDDGSEKSTTYSGIFWRWWNKV